MWSVSHRVAEAGSPVDPKLLHPQPWSAMLPESRSTARGKDGFHPVPNLLPWSLNVFDQGRCGNRPYRIKYHDFVWFRSQPVTNGWRPGNRTAWGEAPGQDQEHELSALKGRDQCPCRPDRAGRFHSGVACGKALGSSRKKHAGLGDLSRVNMRICVTDPATGLTPSGANLGVGQHVILSANLWCSFRFQSTSHSWFRSLMAELLKSQLWP